MSSDAQTAPRFGALNGLTLEQLRTSPPKSDSIPAEPAQLKRRALGFPGIAFLVFFTLLAYALKKEFWKDVK